MADRYFCGCCGVVEVGDDQWCAPCRDHLAVDGLPHDRTYFAQHGVPCPFAVAMGLHDNCDCLTHIDRDAS